MITLLNGNNPVLRSGDLAVSLSFYTTYLGFEPLLYTAHERAVVMRDGAQIHVWYNEHGPSAPGLCCLYTTDVDALYAEFVATGLEMTHTVNSHAGVSELCVLDPDGNLIKFAQAI